MFENPTSGLIGKKGVSSIDTLSKRDYAHEFSKDKNSILGYFGQILSVYLLCRCQKTLLTLGFGRPCVFGLRGKRQYGMLQATGQNPTAKCKRKRKRSPK